MYFELGIKLLAMIHSGVLVIRPNYDDSSMDLRVLVDIKYYEDFDYQIKGDPTQFISGEVLAFYDRFHYLEVFPSAAPSYENVSHRFWEATKLYKTWLDRFEIMKINSKETNKQDNDSGKTAAFKHFNKNRS